MPSLTFPFWFALKHYTLCYYFNVLFYHLRLVILIQGNNNNKKDGAIPAAQEVRHVGLPELCPASECLNSQHFCSTAALKGLLVPPTPSCADDTTRRQNE